VRRRQAVEGEVQHLESQLLALRGKLQELRYEEIVLAGVVARNNPAATENPPSLFDTEATQPSAVEWTAMPRIQAVALALELLSRSQQYSSPAEIEAFLVARGRDDSGDSISAALSYLANKRLVQKVGRAKWAKPLKEVIP
jgi:hypothetical protein